jgi:hypothetical protein
LEGDLGAVQWDRCDEHRTVSARRRGATRSLEKRGNWRECYQKKREVKPRKTKAMTGWGSPPASLLGVVVGDNFAPWAVAQTKQHSYP